MRLTACILAAVGVVLMGCRDISDSGEVEQIEIHTGSPTGAYQAIGQAMQYSLLADSADVTLRAVPSGGSMANVRAIGNGTARFAIAQSDVAHDAREGLGGFRGAPVRDVAAIMGLFYEELLVIARRGSGIREVSEIAPGTRIVVGSRESGTFVNAQHVLQAIGLPLSQVRPRFQEPRGSLALLAKDSVDVVFLTAAVGPELFEQLDELDAHLLAMSPSVVAALHSQYPYYEPSVLETGDGGVTTVRIRAVLITNRKAPRATVRALLGGIYEHLAEIRTADVRAAQILPSNLADVRAVPLHPEALTFFCEVGLRKCSTALRNLSAAAIGIGMFFVLVWASPAVRKALLRVAPSTVRRFVGPKGVTDRYRLFVVPCLLLLLLVTGAFVVQESERAHAEATNERSDFEDLGMNGNLLWMLVFTASGFEDGRFPKSTAGKIASALMGWIGVGGVLFLVGFATSDHIARRLRVGIQNHPDRLRSHIIVCGWNSRANGFLRRFSDARLGNRRKPVVVVAMLDTEQEIQLQEGLDLSVVRGDFADINVLEEAGLAEAHTVLILADDRAPDPDARSLLALMKVEKYGYRQQTAGFRVRELRTIVEVSDPENRGTFEDAHADLVICARDFDELLLLQSVLNPGLSHFLQDVLTVDDGSEVIEVPVAGTERVTVAGLTFDEALLMGRRHGFLLLAIRRNGAVLGSQRQQGAAPILANPVRPDELAYRIRKGDSLLLLAEDEAALAPVFGDSSEWQRQLSA
jgi:uncharacterized protein